VVVHIIHKGEPIGTGTNISIAQIQSQIDALNQDLPVLIKSSNAEVRTSAYFMCQCITAIVSFLILPLAICADLFLIYPMQISFQFLHTKDLEIFSQQYA
jgi:hypothetical protein